MRQDNSPSDREAFKRFERDGFSRIAGGYDRAIAEVTSQVNDALLDAVGTGRGTRLLDVACGPGRLSADAVRRGATVVGVDFAEDMVAIARARCPEAEFGNGDAEHLPFASGRFAAVVCNLGFPHFPDPERALAEAFRVLEPGGRFGFTNWTPPARNPFMALILDAVQTHGVTELDLRPGPPMFRFGDPAECERALGAAGFTGISVAELPVIWHFPSPEDVTPTVAASTVRLQALLAGQTEERRRAIESAVIAGAAQYAISSGIEIPASVTLAAAHKP